ncbi:MAG: metallophosphoesterase [Nitrospirota bacterium]
MFGAVLFSVVTLMHVYVFWRAASVPFVKRHVSRKFLFGTGFVMWTVFSIGRFFGHGSTGVLAGMLELAGMDWMAAIFLTTISFLTVDVVTVFGLIMRGIAPALRGMALAAGVVLSVISLIQGMRPPVVQEYEVRLPGLHREMDGTVLIAMSDLHIGTILGKEWLEARVAQVQAQHPDLVVLLGDIFEGHGEPSEGLLRVMHRLSAPLGVWGVLGNHEFHGRDSASSPMINIDGVRVLSNTWQEVRPGLVLAGVDDLTRNHRSGLGGDPVSKALEGRPAGATVFLSHTPWQAEKAADLGTGLMLSGHTHGGQIWPFGYLTRRVYPLLAGRYEVNGMTVIVCRGTGTWGPRMRLWRPGEILRITLHPEGKG